MGDDDKLGELAVSFAELRTELHAFKQRANERDEMNYKLLRADLEGYLRGRVDSINGNINATHKDLSERIEASRGRVWMLYVGLAGLGTFCTILGALVTTLLAERFGFIVKLPPPP